MFLENSKNEWISDVTRFIRSNPKPLKLQKSFKSEIKIGKNDPLNQEVKTKF
jgi:hypothetical protein